MHITLRDISKKFKSNIVFKNLNIDIQSDSIYCLLGSNGAGKSTIINLLANLTEPEEGAILIDGKTFAKHELSLKKTIGLQSQYNQLIEELNAYDYLHFVGLLYGMRETELHSQIQNLFDYFFDDKEKLKKSIKTFSSGMKKKISICAALVNKPQLLLLDEPFANLDPSACARLCSLIKKYRTNNRIILISSHDLLYVDQIATNIGILEQGELVFNDTLDIFKNNSKNDLGTSLLKYLSPKAENNIALDKII
ncbi:ABC transporter ATP-binding protein [Danxiaibacter flavus]|uniref:ABC transporter ATP-binding protein n=1 Tax=Danxiaibacter flavus TaxID=3049108 RepID=A0ABV3ZG60_9BACT|nr:ABC transporter ATP-binding protein [Chitinophagaceae bacterium DXS]